jgi:hypothetical protein
MVMGTWWGCSGSHVEKEEREVTNAIRGDQPNASPHIRFEEIPNALPGSEFLDGSELGGFALPETTGGGIAVFDYDRDGRMDVCCAGGGAIDMANRSVHGRPGSLFRNRTPFRFDSVAVLSHVDMSSLYSSAILAADFDNDGFVDLTVAGFANLLMFRNMGDGTFEQLPGIDAEAGRWSSAGAYFDADQDGDLDLYVVHYADWGFDKHPFCPSRNDAQQQDYCGPTDFLGLPDGFYINEGDGRWRDASLSMGSEVASRGLGVLAADLDGDRDTDLYVANDVEPNLLFRNDGLNRDGQIDWREVGIQSGAANGGSGKPEGSMGIAMGDFNRDGRFDIWVTNYERELNAMYRNEGKMVFSYVSHTTRIGTTDEQAVGWGTAFMDVDLDGYEDLLVVNGHLEKYAPYHLQRPQLLLNQLGQTFRLTANVGTFFDTPMAGRGVALSDFDSDGRLDFCVTRIAAPHAMVRNTSTVVGSSLGVRLIGTRSNREAIGAVATLKIGNETQIRQVIGGGSYASTSDRLLHFGIPNAMQSMSGTLVIQWPSGFDQEIPIDHWNQSLVIVEDVSTDDFPSDGK